MKPRSSMVIIFLLGILLFAFSCPLNAQWIENRSESVQGGYKSIYFEGYIGAGDTLESAVFQRGRYESVAQLAKGMTHVNDSAKIKIERWHLVLPGVWRLAKTIAASDSTQAANVTADTLTLQNQKLLFIGNSGTGTVTPARFRLQYELTPP